MRGWLVHGLPDPVVSTRSSYGSTTVELLAPKATRRLCGERIQARRLLTWRTCAPPWTRSSMTTLRSTRYPATQRSNRLGFRRRAGRQVANAGRLAFGGDFDR